MSRISIDIIAGARPNFMKVAPIEVTVMGVPYLTLLNNTERPETIGIGTDPSKLKPALNKVFSGEWEKGSIPKKWDEKTSQRIIEKLEELLVAKNV